MPTSCHWERKSWRRSQKTGRIVNDVGSAVHRWRKGIHCKNIKNSFLHQIAEGWKVVYLLQDARWCYYYHGHNQQIWVDAPSSGFESPWHWTACGMDFFDLKRGIIFRANVTKAFVKILQGLGDVMVVSWLQVRCFCSRLCLLTLGSLPDLDRLGSLKTANKGGETLRLSKLPEWLTRSSSDCEVHLPSRSSADVPMESSRPKVKIEIFGSCFDQFWNTLGSEISLARFSVKIIIGLVQLQSGNTVRFSFL